MVTGTKAGVKILEELLLEDELLLQETKDIETATRRLANPSLRIRLLSIFTPEFKPWPRRKVSDESVDPIVRLLRCKSSSLGWMVEAYPGWSLMVLV
jgi:hypothetical protein